MSEVLEFIVDFRGKKPKILDYCTKCDKETEHIIIPDEIFGVGLLCKTCGVTWEYVHH